MLKYLMKDKNDYRLSIDNEKHGVLLIKEKNGVSWAYGYFAKKEYDMFNVSEDEQQQIKRLIDAN